MTNLLLPMEVTYKHFQEAEFMVLKKILWNCSLLISTIILSTHSSNNLSEQKNCDDILVQMCNIPILHKFKTCTYIVPILDGPKKGTVKSLS